MGRLAILLVVIGTAGAIHAGFSRTETRYNTVLTQADYQEKVLARETAESALNLIVANIKEVHKARWLAKEITNAMSYDISLSDEPYRGRKYDVRSALLGTGDIDVTAKGYLGINEYTINALISYKYGQVLNAITFDGDYEHLKINATNKMSVSGLDRKTDGYNKFLGSDGEGTDVHAISVRSEETYTDIFDDVTPQQLEGVDGEGDIVNEPPNIDLAALADGTDCLS